jgi:hypothetical protein
MSSITLKTAIIALADHVLPRLPVILHRGPAGSMVVAGTEAWSRHLPDRFFGAGARTEKPLGSWPVWKIHSILESWRLVRRNGLSWRVSHAPGDLAVFIERDDRPYTRARYEKNAYLRSPTWFFRRHRHGGHVWIERDREPVPGGAFGTWLPARNMVP